MPLPIIIIFERHWDKIPKQVVKKLLPMLAAEGYNTLCFEGPQDLTAADHIARVNTTVEFDEHLRAEAIKYLSLNHVKIDGELSDLNYSTLLKIIQLYVSSKKYVEVTDRIKHYPSDLLMKEILAKATQLQMQIEGVDINSHDFDRIISSDLSTRVQMIDQYETYRNTTFSQNLLKHYKKREGVIMMCGALHAFALISFFKEMKMEDQVIYYFPHSQNRLDQSTDDISALVTTGISKDKLRLLSNEDDVELLVGEVLSEVKARNVEYIREITDKCSHIDVLNEAYKADFKAHMRSGYYVDALLELTDAEKISAISEQLQHQGIKTHCIFFKDKQYLVVPEINTRDTAEKIRHFSK